MPKCSKLLILLRLHSQYIIRAKRYHRKHFNRTNFKKFNRLLQITWKWLLFHLTPFSTSCRNFSYTSQEQISCGSPHFLIGYCTTSTTTDRNEVMKHLKIQNNLLSYADFRIEQIYRVNASSISFYNIVISTDWFWNAETIHRPPSHNVLQQHIKHLWTSRPRSMF